MDQIAVPPKRRDYAKERKLAIEGTIQRVVELREDRNTGALGMK